MKDKPIYSAGSKVMSNPPMITKDHAMLLATMAILIFVGFVSCNKKSDGPYQQCVDKGVAHFKSAGFYPILHSGRNADKVIAERCMRTYGAFG